MSYDESILSLGSATDLTVGVVTMSHVEEAERLLDPAERRRQAGFGDAGRRVHFALGRLALRRAAGERLSAALDTVSITVAADGAPEVTGLHASISHGGAGDAAVGLAAVSGRAVGVDVEPIQKRRPDLWRRILRADEHDTLDALGGPSDLAHTLLWSMKEAVLKGQRTGLRAGARSVRLELPSAPEMASGTARAVSDRSGAWALSYVRRGDLWLVVATAVGSSNSPLVEGEGT